MSITINLNDDFTATLTAKGAEVWNKSFEDVPPKHRPAPVAAGQVIETGLWTLMQVFGPHTWHGMTHTHFVENSIKKVRKHA